MVYFVLGVEFIQVLCDVVWCGVVVLLVLFGCSDVKLVLYVVWVCYVQLLDVGVQVNEMLGVVMYVKMVVIDGVYFSVGLSNFDWCSIVGNNEMDVIVFGDDFGQQMQVLFVCDLSVF